jgi:hypothetical protein
MRQRRAKKAKTQQRPTRHKSEEVAIVAPPHAIIQPDAVVVLSLNAVVAASAVVGARRAPDFAGFAELGRDFHGDVLVGAGEDRRPCCCWWSRGQEIVVWPSGGEWVKVSGENLGEVRRGF